MNQPKAPPFPPSSTLEPPVPTPSVVSRWQRIQRYRLFWWLSLSVFVLDQITKVWIALTIPFDEGHYHVHSVTVIDGFFYLIHVGNTGAAWSLFSGYAPLLALAALLTLVGIYFWRHALELNQRPVQLAFGLLCGGIVGNLVDRMIHGHVIDFLDFHFGDYIYPTFNVADAGICIGVTIYLIHSLRQGPPQSHKSS
jgi:signal peptidase II